ncbi:MAG: hypothetical protein KDC71_17005 [Acidobacteria bacterium]|nr:hypothetical protein [Acidobacteriota bacterium]
MTNLHLIRHRNAFFKAALVKSALVALASALGLSVVFLCLARFSPYSITKSALVWIWLSHALGWTLFQFFSFWRLKDTRRLARKIENRYPELMLKVRSVLDFNEGKSDSQSPELVDQYADKVQNLLDHAYSGLGISRHIWATAGATLLLFAPSWLAWHSYLGLPKTTSSLVFGNTFLQLDGGSISIYEPDYTNIPGRTLALKPGGYEAYPGSRVQFSVLPQNNLKRLFFHTDKMETAQEIDRDESGGFHYEFVLMEASQLEFLVAKETDSGKTQPFVFSTKRDLPPTIELKSYTNEGAVNIFDPLMIDASVRDDFHVTQLEAVVNWEGGEKRIKLTIPNNQNKHFLSRNRWNLSDLVPEDVSHFSIYLEARDNNPVNGPGIGQSESLSYELESPDRKHDEFMEMARELLNRMTHTLGDNLDTELQAQHNEYLLREAQRLSEQIQSGLMQSQSLTSMLLNMMRQDPYITQIDQEFLQDYRNELTQAFRYRIETGSLFASVNRPQGNPAALKSLQYKHKNEETNLEQLTYELLLQLKLWALLELERNKNALEDAMESLQQMMDQQDQSSDMEEQVRKALEQIMKEFQKMMMKAAEEMDRDMDEFMNSEALQDQKDAMKELVDQIVEAMKQGDMEKAKALMEEFRAQMQAAMEQMQSAMGQMSPEMKAMMESMREMSGLLQELKLQEEDLESKTQELRQQTDQKMGGNQGLSPKQKEAQKKLLDNIKKLLGDLNQRLSAQQQEKMGEDLVEQINQMRAQLEDESLGLRERREIEAKVRQMENSFDMIMQDQMRLLQEVTLKSLDSAESMQEYLDHGELMPSLEMGHKLENQLISGSRFAESRLSDQLENQVKALDTFNEASDELYKILDMLQNVKQNMEQQRKDFLAQKNAKDPQQLQEQQESIRKMIESFKQAHQQNIGGSPLFQKLDDIDMVMRNASDRLGDSKLDGGIHYEQEALKRIGEMMEQMQQSQRGQGRPMFMGMGMGSGNQDGMNGSPVRDIPIPESQYQAREQQMREMIRRQMQKSLPDQYGKEIKKYYENLIDQ